MANKRTPIEDLEAATGWSREEILERGAKVRVPLAPGSEPSSAWVTAVAKRIKADLAQTRSVLNGEVAGYRREQRRLRRLGEAKLDSAQQRELIRVERLKKRLNSEIFACEAAIREINAMLAGRSDVSAEVERALPVSPHPDDGYKVWLLARAFNISSRKMARYVRRVGGEAEGGGSVVNEEVANRACLLASHETDSEDVNYSLLPDSYPSAVLADILEDYASIPVRPEQDESLHLEDAFTPSDVQIFLPEPRSRTAPEQSLELTETQSRILKLCELGESRTREFKSSFRYDLREGRRLDELEDAALKAIVAFANTDGGDLLIGVDDEGDVVGLEGDYELLRAGNRDGLERAIAQALDNRIDGIFWSQHMEVGIFEVPTPRGNRDVLLITVEPTRADVYLKTGGKTAYYVRTVAQSRELQGRELVKYTKVRRKKFKKR